MKKLLCILFALCGLVVSSTFAQSGFDYELDESTPLITDVSQLSSPWSASHDYEGNLAHLLDGDAETYWHSNWSNTTDRQYVQVTLNEAVESLISMKYTRRWHMYNSQNLCTENHVTKWSIYGATDPNAEEDEWTLLLTDEAPLPTPGETRNTAGFDTKGCTLLRIYAEDTDTHRHFWHAAEIQLYPCQKADDYTIAINELTETFLAYESFEDPFLANVGTAAGQYTEATVQAFIQALSDANDAMDPRAEKRTPEELKAFTEAIKATYQAVLDGMIPFTLENGYYRIRHSCVFVNKFPTDEEDDEGRIIMEDREVYKYMYSTLDGDTYSARWNTPAETDKACPYIWKVTNAEDGYFDIMNCATDTRFDNVPANNYVSMSKESTNLMAADLVRNVNGYPQVTLRVSTQLGTDHTYLHPMSHGIQASTNQGNGTEGGIIGWANDKYGVSEWIFERVSDDEAEAAIQEYEPYKNRAVMVEDYKTMREKIKDMLEIAKDLSIKYDTEKPYITTVDQLSSPWNAPHEYEGNLAHLIDNDLVTYWHTDWNDNANKHYVQVELNAPLQTLTAMHVVRRKFKYNSNDLCTGDHVTLWGIYGADEPDAEDNEWVELAKVATPYTEPGEELTMLFDPQGKQYLRIYGESTNSGYRRWHAAEIQLYPGEIVDPANSQYHMMGSVATTMETIFNEQKDVDPEKVTIEQYTTFKEAFDAFMDKYVDPTVLRGKIESVKGADAIMAIGTDPGFWKDDSASKKLTQAIAEAEAYDKAGTYVKEQTDALIANLDAAVANIKASAIPVQAGKWYRIRFGTKEEYDNYGWNKEGNTTDYRIQTREGEAPDTVAVLNEALFGKYITVAKTVRKEEVDDYGEYSHNVVEPLLKDEVVIDDQLYSDDKQDIEDPDMALFRFISVGDSAYIIQNKATGLYLQKKAEDNNGIYLSVHPSFFTQEIAGYGQSAFFVKTLNNESQYPLHLARNKNVLITWGSWGDRDGRRGCFFIEEAENVASDYAANTARIKMWDGTMTARCYPVSMQATDNDQGGLWFVSDFDRNEEGGTVTVTLSPMGENKVAAGRPFIYIKTGDYVEPAERDEDAKPALVTFTFGNDFVTEPLNDGILKGCFTKTSIDISMITVKDLALERQAASATVNTNGAYISDGESVARTTEVKLEFDNAEDNITAALQKVAKGDNIYTLDGRFVTKGNLNTLKGLKKGAYIIGHVKVVVK